MQPRRGPKGRGIAVRQRGGALVFLRKFSVTKGFYSLLQLLQVTTGYYRLLKLLQVAKGYYRFHPFTIVGLLWLLCLIWLI